MGTYEIETALCKIENEGPEWLAWCGAMYESYAADHEWNEGRNGQNRVVAASQELYVQTAHNVAEDLEREVFERLETAREFANYARQQQEEYDDMWGCWTERIYDPDR